MGSEASETTVHADVGCFKSSRERRPSIRRRQLMDWRRQEALAKRSRVSQTNALPVGGRLIRPWRPATLPELRPVALGLVPLPSRYPPEFRGGRRRHVLRNGTKGDAKANFTPSRRARFCGALPLTPPVGNTRRQRTRRFQGHGRRRPPHPCREAMSGGLGSAHACEKLLSSSMEIRPSANAARTYRREAVPKA